jgi:hypothetical protein
MISNCPVTGASPRPLLMVTQWNTMLPSKVRLRLGVVVHTYNPSTQEAEVGG